MGKINLLSYEVANLIAAGEVVDRPSSAVKELLENAVDAGASAVTLEIQRGGVSFIRVTDNGCGMEKDDLIPAVTRHSTSKIHTAADLDSILTLGFRGEALAAIASVSRLRIFSKIPGQQMGALLTVEGGRVVSVEDTGCADGTTVIAEDLFYNVPARRKFLKKDSTEGIAIGAVVEKIALSHPEVSFKFISDGEIKFLTSGNGDLRETIWALFGRDTARRALPTDRRENGIRVHGFVSESDMTRSNRNMENFFINGRYIKSKTASAALEQAYASRIPADKFPFCVLNIELNPAAVDVNVHPAKLEVKFANEKLIFDAVYYAVLSALEKEVKRPEFPLAGASEAKEAPFVPSGKPDAPDPKNAFLPMDAKPEKPKQMRLSDLPAGAQIPAGLGTDAPRASKEEIADAHRAAAGNIRAAADAFAAYRREHPVPDPSGREEREQPEPGAPNPAENAPAQLRTESAPGKPAEAPADAGSADGDDPYAVYDRDIGPGDIPEYTLIGEAFSTYLLVQLDDRILLIDKHAAHERILFDELCRKLRRHLASPAAAGGQMLLTPLTVELYTAEADAAEEYRDRIEAVGFAFTMKQTGVSQRTAEITQIPESLDAPAAAELFETLANRLSDATGTVESAARGFFETRLWQASCKAAIKGGRLYDAASLRWICDRILQKPDERGAVIRTCPHGRPVAFEIKKTAIDRQFGRIG
ncbi:MAG: DNA mismatch repair endonuclease MutL [Clostridia bacterium]|nr:DNA mismatch repair endonuclease MutL [Clostridia bacterium]